MGLNAGHSIKNETLKVKRIMRTKVVFEGDCGERFNILADDWPALRSKINKAVNKTKKTPPSEIARIVAQAVVEKGPMAGLAASRW